jgi:flagellar protein FlaJ
MIIDNLSMLFASMLPPKFTSEKVKRLLDYAGSKDNEKLWIGKRFFFCFLFGLIGFLIPFSIFPLLNSFLGFGLYFDPIFNLLLMISFFIIFFGFAIAAFYLHISYVIDGRKKMVENIIPDFLFLVGNNLKSGMTPFYAFRSAVRPEFGPLSEEMKVATQKSLGVNSFSDALRGIAEKIDSKVLSDTTKFFAQAINSGGHLAELIEVSALDIRQTNRLRNELITSTKMYSLFIVFIVVIASPMLLAVSVQFLSILQTIQTGDLLGPGASAGAAGASGMGASMGGLGFGAASQSSITSAFMEQISYWIILANCILAGVFISALQGGKIRDGIKFSPLMAIGSIVVFNLVLSLLKVLLGSGTLL